MSTRGDPVRFGDIAAEALADLWAKTCRWRAARGENPPPEHLNPNRTNRKDHP